MCRRLSARIVGLVLAAAVAVPAATAGRPEIVRIDVDETAPDPFLTEACGAAC